MCNYMYMNRTSHTYMQFNKSLPECQCVSYIYASRL